MGTEVDQGKVLRIKIDAERNEQRNELLPPTTVAAGIQEQDKDGGDDVIDLAVWVQQRQGVSRLEVAGNSNVFLHQTTEWIHSDNTPPEGVTPPQGTKVKLPSNHQKIQNALVAYSVIQNVDLDRAASGLSDARYLSWELFERKFLSDLSEEERTEKLYLLNRDNFCRIPQEDGHDCLVFRLNVTERGKNDLKVANPVTVNPVEWSGYALDRKTIVIGVIGAGANGVVLLAYEKGLDLFRAVKALKDYDNLKQSERDPLEKEAKILCRFDHVNIVKALGLVPVNVSGLPIYCMVQEYCPGDTYSRYIGGLFDGSQRRSATRVIDCISQFHRSILDGLAYAHEYCEPVTKNRIPIIHRDVKPDNIKITINNTGEEKVKILDFGIGRFGERLFQEEQDNNVWKGLASNFLSSHNTTQAGDKGMLKGTPFYAAPEQFMGDSTKAVDVYGATLTFYEGLAGINPFKLDNPLYKTHFGFEALKRVSGKSCNGDSEEQLLSFIKQSDSHIESRFVPTLAVITERTAEIVGVVKQMLERAEENNNFNNLSERYKLIVANYVNQQTGEDGHLRHCFEIVLGNKGDFFEELIKQVNAGNINEVIEKLFNIEELYKGLSREFSKRPELQAIMEKGLAVDYKTRYQSAREALDDFDRYLKGDRVQAYEEKLGEQVVKNPLLRVTSSVAKSAVGFIPAALGYVPQWLVGYKSPNEQKQIINSSRLTTAVATALSTLWLSFRGVSESYAVENARGNITRSVGNLLDSAGKGVTAPYYNYQAIDHSVTDMLRAVSEIQTAAKEVGGAWLSRLWSGKPANLEKHAELIANLKTSLQDYLEFNKDPNKTPMTALTIDCSPETGFDLNEWNDRCIKKLRKIMQICRNLGACEQAGVFEGLSEEGRVAFESLKKSLADEYHDTRLVAALIRAVGTSNILSSSESTVLSQNPDHKHLTFGNKFIGEKDPPPYLNLPLTKDQQKFVEILLAYQQNIKNQRKNSFKDVLDENQLSTIKNPNLRLALAITLISLDANYFDAFEIVKRTEAINNNDPFLLFLGAHAQFNAGDTPNALIYLDACLLLNGGQENMDSLSLRIKVLSTELAKKDLNNATRDNYEKELLKAKEKYNDLVTSKENDSIAELKKEYTKLLILNNKKKFKELFDAMSEFNSKNHINPSNLQTVVEKYARYSPVYLRMIEMYILARLEIEGPSSELECFVDDYYKSMKASDKIFDLQKAISACRICYCYALFARNSYVKEEYQKIDELSDKVICILKEDVLPCYRHLLLTVLNHKNIVFLRDNNQKFQKFANEQLVEKIKVDNSITIRE
ncbi:MAG TPA: protein kinase [Oligoflexia bacterium]|nr:protein kinase [Oligoflexia bacterium]HMP27774.1 protein kinase [Oligoflexia bacterium]